MSWYLKLNLGRKLEGMSLSIFLLLSISFCIWKGSHFQKNIIWYLFATFRTWIGEEGIPTCILECCTWNTSKAVLYVWGSIGPNISIFVMGDLVSCKNHWVAGLIFVLLPISETCRKPAWKDGSTATCVLVIDNILYIANLGDSRVSLTENCGSRLYVFYSIKQG